MPFVARQDTDGSPEDDPANIHMQQPTVDTPHLSKDHNVNVEEIKEFSVRGGESK